MALIDIENRKNGYSLGAGTISIYIAAAKSIWIDDSYEKCDRNRSDNWPGGAGWERIWEPLGINI